MLRLPGLTVLTHFAFIAAAAAFPAAAQQSQRTFKVGLVWNSLPQADLDRGVTVHPGPKLIEDGLRDLGWAKGRNVELLSKSAESRPERYPAIIDAFVRMPVDVLVFFGSDAAEFALSRTKTIPIVIVDGNFEGKVASLRRPGGNVTGNAASVGAPYTKRLELLKAIAPQTSTVAFVGQDQPDGKKPTLSPQLMEACRQVGVQPVVVSFQADSQLEQVFAEARQRGANALMFGTWATLNWGDTPLKVTRLAAQHKLPAMYALPGLAKLGGLIAYGSEEYEGYRRASYFIDRILRGEKPAELPIEQPAKFYLNINRRAARELGLEIPPSLLIQADNVFD
jgi:ABC-type uncharacterized transport system substrate-binding protein